jgi:hypothetical protein
MGTNPCVPIDTWVHTVDGARRVHDLVGKPFVALVDGQPYRSSGFVKTGTKSVFKVTLANGMIIRATDNHQILVVTHQTRKVQRTDWKELGQIRVGERVALHNHRGVYWTGDGTTDEGYLLGNLVGDGVFTDKTAYLDFWGENRDIMADQALAMIHSAVGARSDCRGSEQTAVVGKRRLQSVGLKHLAMDYGITRDRVFGDLVEEASHDFYVGFLRGWFDADGSVQGEQRKGVSVRLNSSNLGKLECAQRMLARLGINSTVYQNRYEAGFKEMPDGRGGTKEYWCQANHDLVIANDNLTTFQTVIGFTDPVKTEALDQRMDAYVRRLNRERFCETVILIEQDGVEDVFDCSVPGPQAFDAGGVYVHNCGEIILRNHGFCNLSIAIVDVDDSFEAIKRKVELATIWGTIQASMTRFRYLRPSWKRNCEEEALLGVDILGHMDCKLLKPWALDREEILQRLLQAAIETNTFWARRLGINPGVALTCGKPSGDSSVFFDKAAGLKAHHGKFYIRRLRFEETNPITKVLRDAKIPWQYDYDKSGICVFEFPCRAPEDAIILGDMDAVEQLENWKTWKVNFTEHNPSCTISVKDHEWIGAGNWVYQNWDIVGGISFYPFDNAVYPLAPYQTITEQEYTKRVQVMPTEIDWSRILLYEEEDETTLSAQLACTGPGCEI